MLRLLLPGHGSLLCRGTIAARHAMAGATTSMTTSLSTRACSSLEGNTMTNGEASSSMLRADCSEDMPRQRDQRDSPARKYKTRVLPIHSDNLQFIGKGKEPMRDVHVVFRETSDEKSKDDRDYLDMACRALQEAHLVAFPTETVYGLAGNAFDAEAAAKIFTAKGRPADNPLIVHVADMDMLDALVTPGFTLPAVYAALVNAFWPGPLTILVPANKERVPSIVRCGLDSLGVRMPSHPVARALMAQSRLPLAAPSANVSGRPSPTTAMHVYKDMTRGSAQAQAGDQCSDGEAGIGRIPFIVDGGPSLVGLESTVVDGITASDELRILRPGGVSVEEIRQCLEGHGLLYAEPSTQSYPETNGKDGAVRVRVYGKDMAKDVHVESNPTTPGMKYRHYSPDAEVVLLITRSAKLAPNDSRTLRVSGLTASNGKPSSEARNAETAVLEQIALCRASRGGRPINVGLMSMDDSPLTHVLLMGSNRDPHNARLWQPLERTEESYTGSSASYDSRRAYTLHGYSLGTVDTPSEAAHRLFDGLRTLDEGSFRGKDAHGSSYGAAASTPPCDIIFVEAPSDDRGVGLAILNRIQKAASRTIVVNLP